MEETAESADLRIDGQSYQLPIINSSFGEKSIDIRRLRDTTGCTTLDSGYGNTGSCKSAITYIDGDKGILRYRGIPIEDLVENSSFVETSYLLIYGHLPNKVELAEFSTSLRYHSLIHEDMLHFYDGYPSTAHPMAILSSMVFSFSILSRLA